MVSKVGSVKHKCLPRQPFSSFSFFFLSFFFFSFVFFSFFYLRKYLSQLTNLRFMKQILLVSFLFWMHIIPILLWYRQMAKFFLKIIQHFRVFKLWRRAFHCRRLLFSTVLLSVATARTDCFPRRTYFLSLFAWHTWAFFLPKWVLILYYIWTYVSSITVGSSIWG